MSTTVSWGLCLAELHNRMARDANSCLRAGALAKANAYLFACDAVLRAVRQQCSDDIQGVFLTNARETLPMRFGGVLPDDAFDDL